MAKNFVTISKSHGVILRARKIQHGYSLLLDIHFDGQRTNEYLNLYISTDNRKRFTPSDRNSLKIAERIKAERIIQVNEGTYNRYSDFNLNSDFITYLKSIVDRKEKDNVKGIWMWRSLYKHFISFAGEKPLPIKSIDVKLLEGFKSYLLCTVAQNTASSYFGKLGTALRYAFREEIIKSNPFDKLQSKIPPQRTNRFYLELDDIKKLDNTKCSYEPLKRAFLFSCFSSLRRSDVYSLKWKDIRESNGTTQLNFRQKKTGSPEWVPLSDEAVKQLGQRGGDNELVFKLMGLTHTRRHLERWGKQAGLKRKLTFHVARHSFATMALTYGVDIYTLQKLMGHKDISSTQVYARIIDQKKQEAVKKLPTLD